MSINKRIATICGLSNRAQIKARLVTPKKAKVNFIEISFANQYIGRADMWRVKESLHNTCVYTNQTLMQENFHMKVYIFFCILCIVHSPHFIIEIELYVYIIAIHYDTS